MLLLDIKYFVSLFNKLRREYYKYGLYFEFVALNNKVGIKRTKIKKMFELAVVRQQKLAKVGLGPELYGAFSYDGYHYIITEVLELPTTKQFREARINREIDFEAFEKAGFYMLDIGTNNFGWKNGKLVPIDFGEF